MSYYRQLAPAAYAVAFLLVVIPFFDAGISVAPWMMGSAQWRFGALGLISNALMIPAAGALVAVVTAVTESHMNVQRYLGIALWVAAALAFVFLGMFTLDAIQSRAQIRPEMLYSYKVATVTAGLKLLAGIATCVVLAKACDLGFRREP